MILLKKRKCIWGVKMSKSGESKQLAVLNFIHERVTDRGYPPTVREICGAVAYHRRQQSTDTLID